MSRAIALRPDLGRTYYNRGFVFSGMKRWDQARRDFQTALRLAIQTGNDDLAEAARVHLKGLGALPANDPEP